MARWILHVVLMREKGTDLFMVKTGRSWPVSDLQGAMITGINKMPGTAMGHEVPDHQLVPFQNVARSMVRVLEFQDVAAMSLFQV